MSKVISPELAARLQSKVVKRGPMECWPFDGARGHYGHGSIYAGKRDGKPWTVYAHRVAWALDNDCQLPPPEVKVRHRCDNPPCCNPAHLLSGTQADNVADMYERQRNVNNGMPGESHPMRKLTASEVGEIRARARAGETQKHLAVSYGVSKQQVSKIVRGLRWATSKKTD